MLVADPHPTARDQLAGLLLDEGMQVHVSPALPERILVDAAVWQPTVLLVELRLTDAGDGFAVARAVMQQQTPQPPAVVLIGATIDSAVAACAQEIGIFGCVIKGVTRPAVIVDTIHTAHRHYIAWGA